VTDCSTAVCRQQQVLDGAPATATDDDNDDTVR